MEMSVAVVVPAYNEAERIEQTLRALTGLSEVHELIVVDDGSRDDTALRARNFTDSVIRLPQNCGKGYALDVGWRQAQSDVIALIDADLADTAVHTRTLVQPVLAGACDMAIAALPAAEKRGGFGLVKGLAQQGVKRLTGRHVRATLSGQRALRRDILAALPFVTDDFGIEVNLTVEALRRGFRLAEVPVPFKHRESGRDWSGFVHRGRQFMHISRTLYRLWRTN